MNPQTFETYAKNPTLIDADACCKLQKITECFPYFQAAQTLLLKGLKNTGNEIFDEELTKRNVFLGNNKVLLDFLSKEFFVEEEDLTFENEMIPYEIPQTQSENEFQITVEAIAENPLESNVSTDLSSDELISFELHEVPHIAEEEIQIPTEIETQPILDEIISFEIEERWSDSELDEEVEEKEEKQTIYTEVAEQKSETSAHSEKPLSLAETILLRVQQMKNNEAQSFSDTKIESSASLAAKKNDDDENLPLQNTQQSIIDKFLAHEITPQVLVENIAENQYDKSARSVQEGEYVTETMAKIYVQQKKNSKAIKIYEQLALQFPQKSVYFAQKIAELQ